MNLEDLGRLMSSMKKDNFNTDVLYSQLIGNIIATLRKQTDLSQADFARNCSLSQPTLSRIESGTTTLDVEELSLISRELKIAPSALLKTVEDLIEKLDSHGIPVTTRDAVKTRLPDPRVQTTLHPKVIAEVVESHILGTSLGKHVLKAAQEKAATAFGDIQSENLPHSQGKASDKTRQ